MPLLRLSVLSVLAAALLLGACSRPDPGAEGQVAAVATPGEGLAGAPMPTAPALAASVSFSEQCERSLPPARITVQVEPEHLQYFNDVPLGGLRHNEDNAPPPGTDTITLGNTHWAPSYSIGHTAHMLRRGSQHCMRPAIEVVFKPGTQTVNVAREFRPGSCGYQHILDHEHRHVQANRAHIAATARQLEQELRRSFGNAVFYADSPGALQQRLAESLKTGWIPYVDSLLASGRTAHQQIDSPEEYARNKTACGGEIARITKDYGARRWTIVRAGTR